MPATRIGEKCAKDRLRRKWFSMSLRASAAALAVAGAANADTPAPESLDDYRNELRSIQTQAAEISGSMAISRSVENYATKLNVALARQRELEAIIEKTGGDIEALKADVRDLDDQWSFNFGDVASTTVGNKATSVATGALSAGAKRVAFFLGWLETGGEYGYRKFVKEQTESQLEDYVEQQQVSLAALQEVWFFQQSAINQLVGDLNTLEALDRKYGQTLQEMSERYPAQSTNPGAHATDEAILDRVTDPAGDAAERKKAVQSGVRRADGEPPVWNGDGKSKIKVTPVSQSGAAGAIPQNPGGDANNADSELLDHAIFFLGGQYIEVDLDRIGAGLVLNGAGEEFVATTGSTFSEFGFGGGVQYNTPKFGGFTFNASYFEDEGSVTGSVASGAEETGNVNLYFNPNNGSTGILFGPSGLNAQIVYDFDYLRIGGAWTPPEPLQALPAGIKWSPTLEWTRFRQNYSTFAEPPAFGGAITDARDIGVKNFYLDFSVEFWRDFHLAAYGPLGSLLIRPYVAAGGTHFKQTLDARETFVCGPCAPEDSFEIGISDKEDGLTWNADFGAMLELGLGGGVSLFGDARYELIGGTSTVFIPRTGDDLFLDNRAAGIEDGDNTTERFSAAIGIKLRF